MDVIRLDCGKAAQYGLRGNYTKGGGREDYKSLAICGGVNSVKGCAAASSLLMSNSLSGAYLHLEQRNRSKYL